MRIALKEIHPMPFWTILNLFMTFFRIAATCSTPDIVLTACHCGCTMLDVWILMFSLETADIIPSDSHSLSGEFGNTHQIPFYLCTCWNSTWSTIFNTHFDTAHVLPRRATSCHVHNTSRTTPLKPTPAVCQGVPRPWAWRCGVWHLPAKKCDAMISYDLNWLIYIDLNWFDDIELYKLY